MPNARRLAGECAPLGNRNAWRHGGRSREAIERRREVAALVRSMRALVRQLGDVRDTVQALQNDCCRWSSTCPGCVKVCIVRARQGDGRSVPAPSNDEVSHRPQPGSKSRGSPSVSTRAAQAQRGSHVSNKSRREAMVVVANVIAVWIGLAEGIPMLWDAGGREAWAWTRAQAASLAWIGVYLDTIAAWDGWPVLIGVVILVGFAMTLQKGDRPTALHRR